MSNKYHIDTNEMVNKDREVYDIKAILQNNYDVLIEVESDISKVEDELTSIIEKNKELEEKNKQLINKVLELESTLIKVKGKCEDTEERNYELKERLSALRNSKLGKINTAYWKFKNRLKESNDGGY